MINILKDQRNLIGLLLITIFSPVAFSMDEKTPKRKFEQIKEIEPTPKKQCLRNDKAIFIDLTELEPEEKLIECQVCLDEIQSCEFIKLSCCSNRTCTTCLLDIINFSLAQKTVAEIVCPNRNCMKLISEKDVRIITKAHKEIYERFCEVASLELINKAENIKHCPTPDCSFSFINDDDLMVQVRCPKCFSFYCCNCLLKHTNEFSCQEWSEYLEVSTSKSAEQEANEKWLKENTRACPSCKTSVQKTIGCDAMVCSLCKYQFCWGCLKTWHGCICGQAPQPQNIHTAAAPTFSQPQFQNNLLLGQHFQNQQPRSQFQGNFQTQPQHAHFQNNIQSQQPPRPHFHNNIQTPTQYPQFQNNFQIQQQRPHFHNNIHTPTQYPQFRSNIQTQPQYPQFQSNIQTQPQHPQFQNSIQTQPQHPQFQNSIQTHPQYPQFQNNNQNQPQYPQFQNNVQTHPQYPQYPQFQSNIQTQPQHPQFQNNQQLGTHFPTQMQMPQVNQPQQLNIDQYQFQMFQQQQGEQDPSWRIEKGHEGDF